MRRLEGSRFTLKTSTSKTKRVAPNEQVRLFAEEHFGSYDAYLQEVRRFIKEGAVRILDVLGEGPLLYRQENPGDVILSDVRQLYDYCHQTEFIDPQIQTGQEIMTPTTVKKPELVAFYVPSADFYLSEDEFSMFVNMTFIPIVCVGENIPPNFMTTTANKKVFYQWGKLAEDGQIYLSLSSLVNQIEQDNLPEGQPIRFEWNDGFCEFYKRQHRLGVKVHQYVQEHNLKLLEAPK